MLRIQYQRMIYSRSQLGSFLTDHYCVRKPQDISITGSLVSISLFWDQTLCLFHPKYLPTKRQHYFKGTCWEVTMRRGDKCGMNHQQQIKTERSITSPPPRNQTVLHRNDRKWSRFTAIYVKRIQR